MAAVMPRSGGEARVAVATYRDRVVQATGINEIARLAKLHGRDLVRMLERVDRVLGSQIPNLCRVSRLTITRQRAYLDGSVVATAAQDGAGARVLFLWATAVDVQSVALELL